MAAGNEVGRYILPIMPSISGIGPEIDRKLGAAFKGISKEASEAIAGGVRDGVKDAEAAVKKSSEAIAKLRDKEAAAADKLRVAEERINEVRDKGGSSLARAEAQRNAALRQQKAALSDIEQQTKALEAAQRRMANAQDDVARSTSRISDGFRDMSGAALSSGTDAAEGFLDGFGGPLATLGTRGGPIGIGLAAAAALGLGAGAAIGKQVMAGLEREVVSDRFAAQLGMTPTQAAQFGDMAGSTYAANFGESLGDVNEAMAQVTSTLGKDAPGAVIEDMTAKALTFRDVFGTDVSESIAHAQNLLVNGLAADASDAFDLMTTAYQRVPAAMRDELPEILNEYSTYFESLGFSGAEAFGMLVNTAPRGRLALDKLGDSLKEFTLLATDLGAKPVQEALSGMGLDGGAVANNLLAGGASAQAQFDQIIDGLLRIPDAGQQAGAAIALFGTPLEDLDKAKIPQFLASLSNADQAMQGFAGSAQQMVATAGDNAAGSVESARRAIELAAGGMQGTMAQAFGPYVQQFATFVTEHQDEITHAFQWMAGAATEFGAGVGFTVSGVITTFGAMVQVIGDGSGWVIDGFEAMVGAAATVADALGQDGMADTLRGAQETLGGFSDDLHDLGTGITDVGLGIGGASEGLRSFDASMAGTSTSAQNAAAQIAGVKTAMAELPNGRQINIDAIVVYRDQNGRPIDPAQLLGFNPNDFASAGDAQRARRGQSYTAGGMPPPTVTPTFTPTTQWTPPPAAASSGGGGGSAAAPAPYFDPSLWQVGSPTGGSIDSALLANVPAGVYDASGDLARGLGDCSSAVEDLINFMDGQPTEGRSMATGNAAEWLLSRGFLPGAGGPGDMRVAFNPSHMQATLPDGTPFNWGSDAAAARGGVGGSGADDPALTSRYYRPAGNLLGAPAGYDPAAMMSVGGGYTVDPQAVFDAESQELTARNSLEQKRLKLLELEAEGNATQSQLLAARNDIAEQERAWASAQMKVAEARRGKLQKASQTTKPGQSGSELGELGSIAGSFFKETFGLDGSMFPDLSQLGIVKLANALMGISYTPQDTGVPGNPFAPAGMPGAAGGGGTSGFPFGMIPNAIDAAGVAGPGMAPPGSPASGVGGGPAPGPAYVDNSRHYNVPAVQNQDEWRREMRTFDRLTQSPPRLETYMPKGS